jgi:hypothetical protein
MTGESAERLAIESAGTLSDLGLKVEDLVTLAREELVEVSVPSTNEQVGLAAALFPWEYVLSAATDSRRGGRPLTVLRHLDRAGRRATERRQPTSLLLVESAPGRLDEFYSFGAELRMIRAKATTPAQEQPTVVQLDSPTRQALKEAVGQVKPDVIHLAGCDNREAARLLDAPGATNPRDGYALSGSIDLVPAEELSGLLIDKTHPPLLVTCNFWNSGARTAALLAAAGATAAVGFQDEFDDSLGELFYSNFYQAWWLSGGNTPLAFQQACEVLRAQPQNLLGSGVILWSLRSALTPDLPGQPPPLGGRRLGRRSGRAGQTPPAEPAEPADQLRDRIESQKNQAVRLAPDQNPRDLLEVEVLPRQRLNYSILHNHRGLFERFRLRKTCTGILRDIEVEVILHAGADNFPFRTKLDMQEDVKDLTHLIRVPLTSSLGRGLREGVRTAMFVQVKWGDQVIHRDTLPVTLLAVDEWRDDDLDRVWLPSFVLPRDPAVAKIITAAHRYLMVLEDNTAAGFDGYQGVDPDAGNPTASVDLEVQAVWASLLHDLPLGYINPPPTFTNASQRLRTPTDVLGGERGTCIDLALLLAFCLEYIDIYPVLFLLKGHAFPGYWSSDTAHNDFKEARGFTEKPMDGVGRWGEPWYLDRSYYPEVIEWVNVGHLVPIETVALTRQGGFGEALEDGLTDLRSKDEFEAMIDLRLARDNDVTPLPISRGTDL